MLFAIHLNVLKVNMSHLMALPIHVMSGPCINPVKKNNDFGIVHVGMLPACSQLLE